MASKQKNPVIRLVLLHGWALGSWVWDNFTPYLKDNWHLSMIDLPGYGKTEKHHPSDIDQIIHHLSPQIPANAILIGWSLGGLIAIKLSRLRHDLKALVLIASSPCFLNKPDWQHGIEAITLDRLASRLIKDKDRALREFASLVASGDQHPRQTLSKLTNNIVEHAPSTQTLQNGLNIISQQDLRRTLSQQQLPIAAILGENDALVGPSIQKAMQAMHNNISLFKIAQTGHAPFLSQPQQTAASLAKFIDTLQ